MSSGSLRFSLSKLYTTVCLFVCPAPRCIPAHTADAPLLRVNRSRTHAPQLITRSWSNGRGEEGGKKKGRGAPMDQITIKTPNLKCRICWCSIEFVDWRYNQSCWYFRPLLSIIALYLLSILPPPTSPLRQINSKHLRPSPFTGQFLRKDYL